MDANLKLYQAAEQADLEKRYGEAATLYRELANTKCHGIKRVPFYLLAADAALNDNAIDAALADCQAALEVDPDSPEAWRSLGTALIADNRFGEAEAALLKSVALSETPTAFVYLAVSLIGQKRINEAEDYCRRAIALSPDFDEAYFNLGRVLSEKGSVVEAIEAYKSAISISPNYGAAYCNLGTLLLEVGNPWEAELCFRKALEIDQSDPDARHMLRLMQGNSNGHTTD